MRVHEFEGAMFEDEIGYMRTIWHRGQFVSSRFLYSFMK